FYGMLVAIPTGIISGPLLARVISRGVTLELPEFEQSRSRVATPSKAAALTVVLMPVVLIALGQIVAMMPQPLAGHLSWLGAASDPVLALLIANLAALPLLFGRRETGRARVCPLVPYTTLFRSFAQSRSRVATPSKAAALTVVLMPVVLIALGQIVAMMPQPLAGHLSSLGAASDPVLALLFANLAALPLLFGRR